MISLIFQQHCKVIIGRNPIEANANTVAIQLPGNPVAYIGKCFTPYQEFLQPLQVNYHLLANYPQKLKQFPVQAKGFADRSVKYLYYTYNLPIYIYSVGIEFSTFGTVYFGKCQQEGNCRVLKGVFSKPSGNYIVSPNLCFLSQRLQIVATCLFFDFL